jgi:type I restriction enzyme S subunit
MSFEISPDFKTAECQYFCDRVADGTHDSPKEAAVGKRLVTSKNVKGGRLELDTAYLISVEDFESINKRSKVDQWDLLLTMIGTVGEVCLVTESEPDFAIKNVGLLKCGDELKSKWLYYFLRSPQGQTLIEERKKGSTQQYVSLTELRNLPISYPEDPQVMRQIVQSLACIDDRITLLRETNTTLEAIAQALFKSWFVDFDPVHAKMQGRTPEGMDEATTALFPDSFEDSELGPVPKGWRIETLGDVCSYLNRGISPKYLEEGGVLVINQKCIRDFSVDYSKARRHDSAQRKIDGRQVEVGDILVNSTGVGTLGRVAQVLTLDEVTIVDSHVTVVRAGEKLSWPYLGQWMIRQQPNIEAMGEGSTGQTELARSKLAVLPILVPSADALMAFDALVKSLKERVAVNEAGASGLAKLRDTLLPRLISGQLRISEAQNEMENV